VYFGETGDFPVKRWNAHVTSNADFLGKLAAIDPDAVVDGEPLFFVGIHIRDADSEPQSMRKLARRAVEAELHKRFALDPGPVGAELQLLSSAPAAPVRHAFNFDKAEIAKSTYKLIAQEYSRWRQANGPQPVDE
jgi:hypothetical protein